jgi:glycosidase
VAANEYATAKFPCAGGFWGIGIHGSGRENRELAEEAVFSYAGGVTSRRHGIVISNSHLTVFFLSAIAVLSVAVGPLDAVPRQAPAADDAPLVTKVQPPNWWLKLTPELMMLLSGRHLEATGVSCNLTNLVVERTQATAGGDYLFVWLKLEPEIKSGTAVCRVNTPTGTTSFELPLAARTQTIHKFQGITPDDVMYLIMPDRFASGDLTNDEPAEAPGSHDRSKPRAYHGGDLRGIREHLDYLKELGVTTLWLTPIVKNGATEDYHGYGAVDLYAVEPQLGNLREYQELVTAAHQQQMKIVFDIVPNHVGPKHPWVSKAPLPDWFHGTAQRHLNSSAPISGAFYGGTENQGHDPFEAIADPHAPPRLSRNLTEGWFVNLLPDMNTENPVVAQYLLQNAIWWTESSGLDGFRVDTFPYVSRQFWARWHAGLRKIYPQLTTIGEVFHPDASVTSFFAGGQKRYDGIDTGVSTLFDYPMYFVLRDVLLNSVPVGRIADVLRHDSLYPRPESLVTFFANHDVPRFASAPGSSAAKLKLAFGVTLTLRGIPQLYYGDEIGMAGGGDPDNRRDFPGGWSDDAKNAFTEAGRTREQQEVFAYVQSLLRLRREHPALRGGRLWHLFSDDSSYVFMRESEEERVLVVFNNSAQARDLSVPTNDTPAQGVARVTRLFGEASAEVTNKEIRVHTPGQSLSIFDLN